MGLIRICQELSIVSFSEQMNRVRSMAVPEGLEETSREFLEKRLEAYEKVVPPSGSYNLQVRQGILLSQLNEVSDEIAKSMGKMQGKVAKLATKLKDCRARLKGAKQRQSLQSVLPYEKLTEALEGFRKSLGLKPNIEDLIYLEGHELKLQIPLGDFKRCLFFMIQAEEIVQTLSNGLLNKQLGLRESVRNFKVLIESLPKQFKLSQGITELHGEIIEGLKGFSSGLQEKCLELMKPENFKELNTTQNTLVQAVKFYQEMIAKGDEVQGFL